jgi:hypothetical protein
MQTSQTTREGQPEPFSKKVKWVQWILLLAACPLKCLSGYGLINSF